VRTQAVLLVVSAVAFGGAWMLMSTVLGDAPPDSVSAARLAASALPNAALLILPALVPLRLLSGKPMLELTQPAAKRQKRQKRKA